VRFCAVYTGKHGRLVFVVELERGRDLGGLFNAITAHEVLGVETNSENANRENFHQHQLLLPPTKDNYGLRFTRRMKRNDLCLYVFGFTSS
jgi:hypothetical protein